MKVTLDSGCLGEKLDIIAEHFNVVPDVYCVEKVVNLPEAVGAGQIRGLSFQNGICILDYKCKFKEDTTFLIENSKGNPIRFLLCLEGELVHDFGPNSYTLNPLEGSITASPKTETESLRFTNKQIVSFTTIEINRKPFKKYVECNLKALPEKLKNVFEDDQSEHAFFYRHNFSIDIARCTREINRNIYHGFQRQLFLEAKALEVLLLQMRKYDQSTQTEEKLVTPLKKRDVKALIQARNILIQNMKSPPTISQLAREIGINEQKLKSGFKQIFNTTINKYVLKVRMEKAKEVLADGDLSIGEVSELVGYSNKGYFSQKFNEHFGLKPSDFVQRIARSSFFSD